MDLQRKEGLNDTVHNQIHNHILYFTVHQNLQTSGFNPKPRKYTVLLFLETNVILFTCIKSKPEKLQPYDHYY